MAAESVMAPPNPLILWYFWLGTTVSLRTGRERRGWSVPVLKGNSVCRLLSFWFLTLGLVGVVVFSPGYSHLLQCCCSVPVPVLSAACCQPYCWWRTGTAPVQVVCPTQYCHSGWSYTHTPPSHGQSYGPHTHHCLGRKHTQGYRGSFIREMRRREAMGLGSSASINDMTDSGKYADLNNAVQKRVIKLYVLSSYKHGHGWFYI